MTNKKIKFLILLLIIFSFSFIKTVKTKADPVLPDLTIQNVSVMPVMGDENKKDVGVYFNSTCFYEGFQEYAIKLHNNTTNQDYYKRVVSCAQGNIDFLLCPGEYNAIFTIDSENDTEESNENNNTYQKTFTITGNPALCTQEGYPLEPGDLIVNNIQINEYSNQYYSGHEIVVTVKNIGDSDSSLTNSHLRLTYGTNFSAIESCTVGNCEVGNGYNAGVSMSAYGKHTLSPGEEYEMTFNKGSYLPDEIEFDQGVNYLIKAIVDDNQIIDEINEDNNTYSVSFVEESEDLKINITIPDYAQDDYEGILYLGQRNVSILRFRIYAENEDATLSSIRLGSDSGDAEELKNIHLSEYAVGTPSISYTTVDSIKQHLVSTGNGMYEEIFYLNNPLTISSGTYKEFAVIADITQARGNIRMGVTNLGIEENYGSITPLPVYSTNFTIQTIDEDMYYISNITGLQHVYGANSEISFSVKGKHQNGNLLTKEEGFHTQVYLMDENGNQINGINGDYISDLKQWDINLTAPLDTTLYYNLDISLYCASSDPTAACYDYTSDSHLNQAKGLYTFDLVPEIQCTSWEYSDWNECIDGHQYRTVRKSFPSGCNSGNPQLTQGCEITTEPISTNLVYNIKIKRTQNSATITWDSSEEDKSYLLYGTENTPNGINRVSRDDDYVKSHELFLDHLLPNTTYYFQIHSRIDTSQMIESRVVAFRTERVVNPNRRLSNRLRGHLLLSVEDRGRVFYVNPGDIKKYEVTFANALHLFEKLAIGITNNDLNKISLSTDNTINTFGKEHSGKLFLQVEDRGRIWYVDMDGKKHEVTWENLMSLFTKLSLGITNNDLDQIENEIILDTDNDGLNDADEVIYGTDMNNPDSDGDGYLDGDEVENGYNPMGDGKL
jgi:uncharacterized protein YciU (UPF0263 family)